MRNWREPRTGPSERKQVADETLFGAIIKLGYPQDMSNPAQEAFTAEDVSLSYGTVTSAGESLLIRCEFGQRRARRAASCIVEPAMADRVLIASDSSGENYVLAVLVRRSCAPTRLSVDGDLSLEARSGKIGLVARDGVEIGTSGSIGVVSNSLDIHSATGNVSIGQLSFFGSFLQAKIESLRLVAGALQSVVEVIHQQAKRVFRRIDEIEQTKAGQLDCQADGGISMHGKYLLITAAQVVKVDGEQIQLG